MRTIIAGSRAKRGRVFRNDHLIKDLLWHTPWPITHVISGMADGVDEIGLRWAEDTGIPTEEHPYPKGHGKQGGPIRNARMAEAAEALVLIWDGESPGGRNMLEQAKQRGLRIFEVIIREHGQ